MRTLILAACAALLLPACSILKIDMPRQRPEDWTMAGGGIRRLNEAREALAPPLAVAWENDLSAGFGPSPAAAVESLLFVANLKGELEVLRMRDGREIGDKDFGSALVGTPVIDRGVVYLVLAHDEESFQAYDLQTAKTLWKARLGDIEASPLLIGDRLYAATLSGKLVCIGKSDGKTIWTYETPEHVRTNSIRSSPASDGDIVAFGTESGAVFAVDAHEGTLKWRAEARGAIVASPVVTRGLVVVGSLDSTLYAFDAATGARRWAAPLGSPCYAAQAADSLRIYAGTAGHAVVALDAATGARLWTTPTEGPVLAAPLLAGPTLYAGCGDRRLYAFNAATGDTLWTYTAEGRIKAAPIIAQGHLFLFAEDFTVIALKER